MAFIGRALLCVLVAVLFPVTASAQSSDNIRCSIRVSPERVAAGQNVTLTWSSFGATSASLEGIGSVPISGRRTVQVTASKKFALTVRKGADHHICFTEVTVMARSPSCFISAWPQNIEQGHSATITWGSSNASQLFITNLGSVPPSGTRAVNPTRTMSYTLTAQGVGVPCVQTTHVNVSAKTFPYGYFPAVANTLFSPFYGNSSNSAQNSYSEETIYYDDKWDEYDDFHDNVYTEDIIDTDGCSWWDYWCGYDTAHEVELEGDVHDPCMWDYWCGDDDQVPGDDPNQPPYGYIDPNEPTEEWRVPEPLAPDDSWCGEYGPDSGMCGQMPWSQDPASVQLEQTTYPQDTYEYWETSSGYYQAYYESEYDI
ncbi:MAG: Non-specific serine/threonine protein kinase [Parcubacteria group bacterium Gr01-1014_8]|nr:MAG: Non-specific serine/threonine protein kinase [Parcubacteria group bacterium Gr01-1014_8]